MHFDDSYVSFFFLSSPESPPAAMSRNGYFFEESGKYYLTFLRTHLVGGRAALQG